MTLIEIPHVLKGELNSNYWVHDKQNHVYLRREPYDNPSVMKSIWYEYAFMGFFRKGGSFRRRNLHEQYYFSKESYEMGLRVLPPLLDENGTIYYPFLDQTQHLDKYMTGVDVESSAKTIFQLFSDLKKAHDLGIIYGDRWPPNILISPQWGVVNIDFDIEISGKCAKEFEIAQATYYALQAGKEKVIPVLARFLHIKDWFDLSLVKHFLKQHSIYFRGSEYGGVDNETETLLEILDK